MHPGLIQTDLTKGHDPVALQEMLDRMMEADARAGLAPFAFKSVAQGVATGLWAGLIADADEVGGRYCENCAVANLLPEDAYISPLRGGVRAFATDPLHAEAAWTTLEN